jgi:hypothetical protein
MAANWPYGEFYDFYSAGPEYFGYHHVHLAHAMTQIQANSPQISDVEPDKQEVV